ncbi:MAG TPA: cysteine-rich CWC family protein [Bradyrhizobium sp.]|nr:cysteine-rich CWC family protein [Bradyrhizobium sp.]
MTDRPETPASRRLACSRCGAAFDCNPAGSCWCADESFRLPMPSDGGDCLCPDCLRKMAREREMSGSGRSQRHHDEQ